MSEHGTAGEPATPPPAPSANLLSSSVRAWFVAVRPRRRFLRNDLLAGLPGAISSVPDGMATALLAGVNPSYGLYASFSGKIGGGLTTSTTLMVVTTTTAASLAAGSALADIPADGRDSAIVTLTILTGVLMIAAGALHLGRYIRFVSRSVMLGFLTGVAVNILLGQLAGLLGSPTDGGVAAQKAAYVITHLSGVNLTSSLVGVSALVVMFLLARALRRSPDARCPAAGPARVRPRW
ncbi:MAG TPA: SulP family inorganic anion transporter [Nakamurella sp.]